MISRLGAADRFRAGADRAGWRVAAAGCAEQPDETYECVLESK